MNNREKIWQKLHFSTSSSSLYSSSQKSDKSNHLYDGLIEMHFPKMHGMVVPFLFSRWLGSHSSPILQSQIRIIRKVMKTADGGTREGAALIIWLTKSAWWCSSTLGQNLNCCSVFFHSRNYLKKNLQVYLLCVHETFGALVRLFYASDGLSVTF